MKYVPRHAQKVAQRAARWVVNAMTGNGLAQTTGEDATGYGTNPELAAHCRRAAAEGCVLLTNDGTLPLDAHDVVAVFGRCQLDWFYMGHGSGGDVKPPYRTNLIDGLDAAGVTYNHVLAQAYATWCANEEHEAQDGWWGHWPTHHPEMPVTQELVDVTARTARVAIVVIGRCAGEDLDLPLAPGGYYLTDEERSLLNMVTSTFAHTVVVINSGNVIDLSWTKELGDRLSAVLMAWQGGMEAGNAVVDVLFGTVNPSGRLCATIARSYEDYPGSKTFGRRNATYDEGIFVGYRYFDAAAPGAVLFPFGHGLSYTTFSVSIEDCDLDDGRVLVRVRVRNTGGRAGRRAVLLWCQPPESTMQRPSRVLAAFGKTGVLAPGGTEELQLVCDLKTIAVYRADRHSFVVEPGSYQFDCTHTAAIIDLPRIVVETCHPLCTSTTELRNRIESDLSRAALEGPHADDEDQVDQAAHSPAHMRTDMSDPLLFGDVVCGDATLDEFVDELDYDELVGLTHGEGAMNSVWGTPGNAGAFGGVTQLLRERHIPAAICADGPSGARLRRRCTLLPCATALACTWDTDLVRGLYVGLGYELRHNRIDVLLAPGLNIQRNARCGRNFEYFSEDPLVSGKMAAAVVTGLQSTGIAACPKHFACNNQEAHRNVCDALMDERTLREVYLRGFEICVREAAPRLVMTSYNKINGVWTHYNYDLATTVLRNEWGFDGVTITDWWMRPAQSPEFPELRDNAYRLRAGVDVLMPGSMSRVLPLFPDPRGITDAELRRTAHRVLAFLLTLSR